MILCPSRYRVDKCGSWLTHCVLLLKPCLKKIVKFYGEIHKEIYLQIYIAFYMEVFSAHLI